MATFNGDNNDNVINGTSDDDQITVGGGSDTAYGGAGNDWFYASFGNNTYYGGDGADTFEIGIDDDFIFGGEGGFDNDWIVSLEDNDADDALTVTYTSNEAGFFTSPDGDDGTFAEIEGWELTDYNDTLDASVSTTNVTVYGDGGDDTLTTGSGDDDLIGGLGNDTLTGNAGNDALTTGDGTDIAYGGAGNDWFFGSEGINTYYGGDDADTFNIGIGQDTVYGGEGGVDDDWLITYDYQDAGDALTVTFTGDEQGTFTDLDGDAGNFYEIEALELTDFDDTVDGSASNATMTVVAGGGADNVTGGSADDIIYGQGGNDILIGGGGNDQLDGGADDDTLTGGTGDDVFVYTDGSGNDTVTDFDLNDDDSNGFYNDQLDVSALTDADGNPVNTYDVVVSDDGFGNAKLSFPNGESVILQGVTPSQISSGAQQRAAGIPCFTAGTEIETAQGPRQIECLRVGDLVVTADHGLQPVQWIAQTRVDGAALSRNPKLAPVLLRKGVLGARRDLLVSPQHGVLMDNAHLVRATHLARHLDGRVRIARGKKSVRYLHLLFAQHQIVFANGVACESFYPGPFAMGGLAAPARASLLGIRPELRQALTPQLTATHYGATARPFLNGRALRGLHDKALPPRAQLA